METTQKNDLGRCCDRKVLFLRYNACPCRGLETPSRSCFREQERPAVCSERALPPSRSSRWIRSWARQIGIGTTLLDTASSVRLVPTLLKLSVKDGGELDVTCLSGRALTHAPKIYIHAVADNRSRSKGTLETVAMFRAVPPTERVDKLTLSSVIRTYQLLSIGLQLNQTLQQLGRRP